MPHFLTQWCYQNEQVKALIARPHDRAEMFRQVVEAFGGRLVEYYFAFGDYDGVAITEFPDNESCAACMMSVGATSAASKIKTTVLLSPNESQDAMRRAKAAVHGYVPPIGYDSHG